jgi:hypothetical protein
MLFPALSLYNSERFYEDAPQDNFSFAFQRKKLVIRKGPPLWQRLLMALASIALWAGMILCFVLAWDYTWSHDLDYTRIILIVVALLMTLYFIFVNIRFNRKRL